MFDFEIKQYATRPRLEAVLKRGGGAIDIQNSEVKLVLRPRTDPSNLADTLILTATVDDDGADANRGKVHYDFTSSDTAKAGEFLATWHVKYTDDSIEVIPMYGAFTLLIEESPDAFATP